MRWTSSPWPGGACRGTPGEPLRQAHGMDRRPGVRDQHRTAADRERNGEMAATEPETELDPRFSEPDASATSWTAVRQMIDEAELFWISTVRPDGRPHVTPLPAVWCDSALYFCTGAEEQKGVNLARNPQCALTTGNNEWKSGLDVGVEGAARVERDEDLSRELG